MFIVPQISSSENRGRISGLENISKEIVQKREKAQPMSNQISKWENEL